MDSFSTRNKKDGAEMAKLLCYTERTKQYKFYEVQVLGCFLPFLLSVGGESTRKVQSDKKVKEGKDLSLPSESIDFMRLLA